MYVTQDQSVIIHVIACGKQILSLPTVTCLLILNSCHDGEMMYIQCRVSQLCIQSERWIL